mmetsp:Transcript_15781/g.35545  ORF Transcript_15781/g.35545 Transcript_15781/m.35545 type:complete len:208 (+) Transcript_15781:401-1024(+)
MWPACPRLAWQVHPPFLFLPMDNILPFYHPVPPNHAPARHRGNKKSLLLQEWNANYVPSTQVFSFQLHHHSHHTACLVPTPTYFPFSICPSTICCRKMMTTSALRRNCAENANVSNIALESHTFAGASVPPWSDYPKGATLTQMQLIPPPPQSHPSRDSSSHYAETFTFKMVSLAVSAWSMINPPYMHPMLPNRRPLLLIPTLPVLS